MPHAPSLGSDPPALDQNAATCLPRDDILNVDHELVGHAERDVSQRDNGGAEMLRLERQVLS